MNGKPLAATADADPDIALAKVIVAVLAFVASIFAGIITLLFWSYIVNTGYCAPRLWAKLHVADEANACLATAPPPPPPPPVELIDAVPPVTVATILVVKFK